jgi:hypothetical protein
MSKNTEKSLVTSESTSESRRQFVKKAAYVAPAVLSLQAASAFARVGSSPSGEESGAKPIQVQTNVTPP